MTFKPPNKPKRGKMIGLRLSEEDTAWLVQYAKNHNVSAIAMSRAMIEHAIYEIRGKKGKKK